LVTFDEDDAANFGLADGGRRGHLARCELVVLTERLLSLGQRRHGWQSI
jgi:hypothetical protein